MNTEAKKDGGTQDLRPAIASVPFNRFQHRFVPWYSQKFAGLVTLARPLNYAAQAVLWYFGLGFIWIPIWFLMSESEAQGTSSSIQLDDAEARPLRQQLSEAIRKVD